MAIDLEPLQGTWDVVGLEAEGRSVPPGMLGAAHIVISGDRFASLGMGAEYSGTIKGDDSMAPRRLDINFTEGEHAGKASLAIFEVDGDTWRLCLCLAGGTRPTEFKTSAGSGHVLEVLRKRVPGSRQAESKTQPDESGEPFPACTDQDIDLLVGEWTMTALARDGEQFPARFLQGKRVADRETVTVTVSGQVVLKARYRVDSSVQPKQMFYAMTAGENPGANLAGIYSIEGDTLQTFMGAEGAEMPVDFEPHTGDGRTYAVWKRG